MRTLLPWPQATDFAGAAPLLLEEALGPRVSTAFNTNTAKYSRDSRAASPTQTQRLSHPVAFQLALGRTSRNTPSGKAKLAWWLHSAVDLSSSPLVNRARPAIPGGRIPTYPRVGGSSINSYALTPLLYWIFSIMLASPPVPSPTTNADLKPS